MALSALGVVFGDIGTSPLYTLKTVFDFLQGDNTPDRILGILSLVTWTLFVSGASAPFGFSLDQ